MSNPSSQAQPEVIAVVLPDGTPEMPSAANDFLATGTMLMVRYPDGRVGLEPVRREVNWQRVAGMGEARKSRPICDPITREVLGYEMVA